MLQILASGAARSNLGVDNVETSIFFFSFSSLYYIDERTNLWKVINVASTCNVGK
jgi:hypothetical protein